MLYEVPAGVGVSYVTRDARHAEVLRPQSLHRPVDVLLASTAHDDVRPVAAEAFSDGQADSATTNEHLCQTMKRNTLHYQTGNGPAALFIKRDYSYDSSVSQMIKDLDLPSSENRTKINKLMS